MSDSIIGLKPDWYEKSLLQIGCLGLLIVASVKRPNDFDEELNNGGWSIVSAYINEFWVTLKITILYINEIDSGTCFIINWYYP